MRTLFLYLFFISECLIAQQYKQTTFDRSNGIFAPSIFCITKDSQGYMWLGTNTGALRYDGKDFKKYEFKDGLTAYSVYQIHEDSQGRIWFLTDTGEPNYYWKGKLYNPQNTPVLKEMIQDSFLYGFLEDDEHNIWLGSFASGFKVLKQDNTILHGTTFQNLDEKDPRVMNFWPYKDSQVLAVCSKKLVCFDRELKTKEWEIEVFPATSYLMRCNKINKTQILAFCNDDAAIIDIVKRRVIKRWKTKNMAEVINVTEAENGRNLVGTRNGLYVYENNELKPHSINSQLSNYAISNVLEDKIGNLWVSTLHNGLQKFGNYPIKKDFRFATITNPISTLGLSRNNELLIGTQGNALFTFSDTLEARYYKKDNGVTHTILDLNKEEKLVFSENKISYLNGKKSYSILTAIKSATLSNDSTNIYLGHIYGVTRISLSELIQIIIVGSENSFPDFLKIVIPSPTHVNSILYKNEKKSYFGSQKGLYIYTNGECKRFEHPDLPKKLYVFKVSAYGDGWLAIATLGHGVILVNPAKDLVKKINNDSGLADNFVTNLYVAKDETIWIKHNIGLSSAEESNGKFIVKNYGSSDGLDKSIVYCVTEFEGKIILGTSSGIYSFTEMDLSQFRKSPSNFKFESISTSKGLKEIKDSKVSLKSKSEFTVHFDFISYSLGENINYHYRLNQDWLVTESEVISYSGLPPGNHTLEIYASNQEGNTTTIARLEITSIAEWYQSTWFKILIPVLAALLIYLLFKAKILNINTQESKELWSRIKALRNKENPVRTILIKTTEGKMVRIIENDLIHISAAGNYVEYFTPKRKYLSRNTLKETEIELVNFSKFIRVHRSHIVNIDHIKEFQNGSLLVGSTNLPIGKNYIESVEKLKNSFKML